MGIKTLAQALTNLITFGGLMSTLICIRKISPKAYQYIENNYANLLVKTTDDFCTIVPKDFLNYSTQNTKILESLWQSFILTINSSTAKAGTNIKNFNLPVVDPVDINKATQLSSICFEKDVYYILNFGSSS